MKSIYSLIFLFAVSTANIFAQCPVGQAQVTIEISTDDWGYEGYFQLVPAGNTCGVGTIFEGGNTLVGCNGGGAQNVSSGGYGNHVTVTEGPWCLDLGSTYDIIFVDDYGDGGFVFTVNINGFPIYTGLSGTGNGAGSRIPFVVQPAFTHDVSGRKISMPTYVNLGNVNISGILLNRGTDTLTSMDLNYSIDNGTIYTTSISGISVAPFTTYDAIHPTAWTASANGIYSVKMWASNINGTSDLDQSNDTASKLINVGPATPNYIDDYIGITTPLLTVIGSAADGIDVPRDLDFHPVLTRNELWVILKSTENSGGKTVKFTNAGQIGQTSLLQQDGNAWHFMSLPTGIAFSDNENFATSPGVYDANHGSGTPFTGPTLWSSDPLIYAQPSGGNGSHLDMLHQSPHAMGICHEVDNAFWVYDANENDIVRYDFVNDHGPGNSDHSDGIIRRFGGLGLMGETTHHVPSHLILDKETNMLYIVDTGNDRVLRMDITSGTFLNNLSPYEPTAEYSSWGNVTFNLFADSGLTEPSGIDLIGNRLIVSDFATGDIIIYDKSTSTGVELGRIVTGTPGIMGVKIGPDGKIWYVNATTNEVIRIDGISVDVESVESEMTMNVYPNPATSQVYVSSNIPFNLSDVLTYDVAGKLIDCSLNRINDHTVAINIDKLSQGVYFATLKNETQVRTVRFMKK